MPETATIREVKLNSEEQAYREYLMLLVKEKKYDLHLLFRLLELHERSIIANDVNEQQN